MLNLRNAFCGAQHVLDAHQQAVDGGRAERRAGGERRDELGLEGAVDDAPRRADARTASAALGASSSSHSDRNAEPPMLVHSQPSTPSSRGTIAERGEAAQDREATLGGAARARRRARRPRRRSRRAASTAARAACRVVQLQPCGLNLRKSTVRRRFQPLPPASSSSRCSWRAGRAPARAGRAAEAGRWTGRTSPELHRQGARRFEPRQDGAASAAGMTLCAPLWARS